MGTNTNKTRYATPEEAEAARKAYQKEYQARRKAEDPEFRERKREAMRRYGMRQRGKKTKLLKPGRPKIYKTYQEKRAAISAGYRRSYEKYKLRWATDPVFKEHVRKIKAAWRKKNKEKLARDDRARYLKSLEYREKRREISRRRRERLKAQKG